MSWLSEVNWTAISAICGLVQSIVVVASLWHVIVQLRQGTKALVAGSLQEVLESDIGLMSDYIQQGLDPHFTRDDVELSPAAERIFLWQTVKFIKIREYAWQQYRIGTLDEDSWQTLIAPLPMIFGTRRARAALDFYPGNPEFMVFLKQQIAEAL